MVKRGMAETETPSFAPGDRRGRLPHKRRRLTQRRSPRSGQSRPPRSAEDDLEIEREMLDGLTARWRSPSIVESGLPAIPTGHRIVGHEIAFSAPSRCQTTLHSDRAAAADQRSRDFQGGVRGTTIAWHTVGDAAHVDRDLVLVTVSRESLHRFRCNTYADAMCAAHLARLLSPKSRRAEPGV